MKNNDKMNGIKLIKVGLSTDWISLPNSFVGIAVYKTTFGFKKYVKFLVRPDTEFKITYLKERGSKIPKKEEQNEALLTLIYGKIGEVMFQEELQKFFIKKHLEKEMREEQE